MLVEADPAGGDLEAWCGPFGEPGLLRVAAASRANGSGMPWVEASVEVVPRVRAVLAPMTAPAAEAVLRSSGELAGSLAGALGTVVVDCGRFSDQASAWVGAASLVLVVCRPTLASIEHTRGLLSVLGADRRVGLLVVGEEPYPPGEVAGALRVPLAGVLPWDPRGLRLLATKGATGWRRTPLSAACGEVLGWAGAFRSWSVRALEAGNGRG